jgi:5'-deoxynucleotidase
MIPLNFRDVYRASHVRRWHVVNVHRQQSLAEHMWLVAMTAFEIAKRLKVERVGAPLSMDEFLYAMEHDLPEVRYGDIPTPGKRMIRAEGEDLNRVESNLTRVPLNYDPNGEVSSIGLDIVKLADVFEGVFFIEENGYGRHAEAVAHDARAKFNDLVKIMIKKWPGLDWHNVINTMLSDVGSLPLQPLYGE